MRGGAEVSKFSKALMVMAASCSSLKVALLAISTPLASDRLRELVG